MRTSVIVLWILMIIVITLNGAMLYALNLGRMMAIDTLTEAELTIAQLAEEVVRYDVQINQAVPVKAMVPFKRDMAIPLNTVIPIDQLLSVPVQTPAGEILVDLPLRLDFPVDIVVPVSLDEEIDVDTTIHLNTSIPIEIEVARTPLVDYLAKAHEDILRLRNRLSTFGTSSSSGPALTNLVKSEQVGYVDKTITSGGDAPVTANQAIASPTQDITTQPATVAGDTAAVSPTPLDVLANGQVQVDGLPQCVHDYWPIYEGMAWAFNSSTTSYMYGVDQINDHRIYFSSQYEELRVQFELDCTAEGLGSSYGGDMRRISEFGNLQFINASGPFLPKPEVMEMLGQSWTQQYTVIGSISALYDGQVVPGIVQVGQAVMVYTPVGYESFDTPLGTQDALKVTQKVDIRINAEFDIEGEKIAVNEAINLDVDHWLVKGLGPTKIHWHGGSVQQTILTNQGPINREQVVASLPEEKLAFICVSTSGADIECVQFSKDAQTELTVPAVPELDIPLLQLPSLSEFTNNNTSSSSDPARSASSENVAAISAAQLPDTVETPESDEQNSNGIQDSVTEYLDVFQTINNQVSGDLRTFFQTSLDYQSKKITLEEYKQAFSSFQSQIQGSLDAIAKLNPPPTLVPIHLQLSHEIGLCTQALEALDSWFETFDDQLKDDGIAFASRCVDGLTKVKADIDAFE